MLTIIGTHISSVKSISLDDWKFDLLKSFKALGGNAAIRRIYGKNKIAHYEKDHVINDFIQAKYVKKSFAPKKTNQKKKAHKIKKQKSEKPKQRKQNKSDLDCNSLDSDPKLWISFEEDSDDSNYSNKENNSTNHMIPDLIACDELKNFNFLSDLSVIPDGVQQPLDALTVNENKLNKREILAKYNENKPESWIKFDSTPRIVSSEHNVWKFEQQKPIKKKKRASPNKKMISEKSVNEIVKQIAPAPQPILLQKPVQKKHPLKPVSVKRQQRMKQNEAKKQCKSFNPWSYIDDLCNYDGNISY